MTDEIFLEYQILKDDGKFIAIDSTNEVVGAYKTEQDAERNVNRAKLEDAMYKHAKILFHASVASVMNEFGVDRDTARYWVATASEQA
jgi:hypothetical protein